MRNARWAPLYDARLDTGTRERKPALELVRRAEILRLIVANINVGDGVASYQAFEITFKPAP